jgi:hypothetical protein
MFVDVDYEGGEGWSVRMVATQRGDPTRVQTSEWYDRLDGDELLEVLGVLCEQAWQGKALDGRRALQDPQLPFDVP